MLYHLFGHPMSPIFGWILTINYNPHHCCAPSIYVWCIPKYPRALNTVKGYHSLDLKYVYIVVYLCKNHVHIYIWYKHILYMQSEYTHYLSWTENSPSVHESSWWSLLSTWKKTMCHQSISKLDHIQSCIINTAMKYPTKLMINCPTVSILQLLTSMMIIIV